MLHNWRGGNFMKRAFALITLVAISATPAFSVVFDTASGTNWFDDSNYAPVGVPSATTNVDIFSTAAVAAEIQSAGALANQVKLGRSNWTGSLVVGASGTLATTSNLTLQLAANGNQTSSLSNHGVINLGGSLKSSGINTIENNGILTATGMVLGSHADAESHVTNSGTIDLGSSGWLHLCVKSTVGTEFTMLDGTVIAKRLNLHDGRKVNLKLYGGTIRVNGMTSASGNFLIDVKGDGELILKGDAVSKLDGWIAAGHVFTSAGSGGVVAAYDADSKTTRLRIDPNGSSGVFEVDYIRGCGSKKTDHAVWAAGWYGNELGDPWAVRGRNGLTNQHARLWGMDPYALNRVSPITQPLNMSNGVFSYTRRDVGLSGAAYSVWVPTDLVNWTEDTNATQVTLSTDFQTDIETMQVNLSSAWLDHDDLFI